MSSVLITGASRGIGRGVAQELVRRGHHVVATARDPESLADLGAARALALDVTDPDSVARAVADAGEIDVLFSNAGVIFHSSVEEIPLDRFAELLDLNTLGALRVVQAVLPQMRARGAGRILLQSSIVGRMVAPSGSAYAATKWATEALGEALAAETARFGISVGLLEPGAVSSGALDDVTRYTSLPGDPYAPGRRASEQITVAQAATEMVDAVEAAEIPLRIPVGDPARAILAARAAADAAAVKYLRTEIRSGSGGCIVVAGQDAVRERACGT